VGVICKKILVMKVDTTTCRRNSGVHGQLWSSSPRGIHLSLLLVDISTAAPRLFSIDSVACNSNNNR
jgi:hypothetical protein